jgi:hypothetical protein
MHVEILQMHIRAPGGKEEGVDMNCPLVYSV